MLPAGLRGFASRMGRFASLAFAWNKDGAVARPARTLLRALFAMILAAATLLAMLILPPVNKAKAGGNANVLWDYNGIGYIAPSSVDAYDVTRDVDVKNPVFTNKNGKTIVTWEVLFNKDACRVKSIDNPALPCDPNEGSHSYEGRPDFFVVLPSDVKDETVRVTRYRTKVVKVDAKGKHFGWGIRGKENGTPYENFKKGTAGWTNDTLVPGDPKYDELWNDRIARCGVYSDDACEARNWKQQGKFGRLFKSWEQSNTVDGIRWVISAEVNDGVDPYNMPFMAGFVSYGNKSDKNKFIIWGPYDHDGDGIPDSKEWFYGFNPESNDDVQFPDKSEKDGVYGEITDVNPYFKRGEWKGLSANGHFEYDGTKLPFEQTNAGITFSFKKGTDGKEILPNGVTKASNPNNIQPGQAYIDPITGKLKYNPKKTDRGHTIHFDVQITYPNPSTNSCKYKKQVEHVKGVDIKVVSQASIYNPHYETLKDVEPTSTGINNPPKSVKDHSKKNYAFIKSGDLPNGTTFEIRKYYKSKNYKGKDNQKITPGNELSWSEIKKDDKKITSGNKGTAGRVYFTPGYAENGEKNKTSVVVTYPDGSSSEDEDAGNVDKSVDFKSKTFDKNNLDKNVVYAPVEVKQLSITNRDLHLDFHKWTKPNTLKEYDGGPTYNPLGSNEVLKFTRTVPIDPQVMLDSWSNKGVGKIDFRAICYKKNGEKKSDFTFLKPQENNFNGLSLGKTFKFTHASTSDDNKCKNAGKNGSSCQFNKYIYSWESSSTTERSRAAISGTPRENGKFGCRVYALRKDKSTDYAANFDNAVTTLTVSGVYNNFTQNLPTLTHKDFNFEVNSMSHYYNPKYEDIKKLQAGEKGTSGLPKSFKNANGAKSNQDAVKNDEPLPDGTWFEFKQYMKNGKPNGDKPLNYAFFENDDDNVKSESGKKTAKNAKGKFGNVTFHPHRWINANRSDNAPVIVHYPDGSSSQDTDSGNNGNPVYAKVNVVPHDYNPGDLRFDVTNNFNNGGWDDKTIKINKGDSLTNSHPRRLNLWSTHKPGKIELRTICHKIIHKDNEDTTSEYTWNGIAGITMEKPSIWDHQEDPQKQHKCYGDKKQCDASKLYDDYVINGNSRDTTERTRASLVGKGEKSGNYECVVYAIKQGSKLLSSFDNAVKSINTDKNKQAKPSDSDPLDGFQWKLDDKNFAVKGVDYEYRVIPIHILSMAHLYNPKYVDVSVKAGNKVVAEKPKSVKGSNGATEDQDDVKGDSSKPADLPDGTWFEIKKYAKAKDSKEPLNWSFMAKQKGSKPDSHNTSGEVTFHPDVTISATDYVTPVVVHYPDGSTSEDEDAGNQGKPVYAKVKVEGLGQKSNLQLKLYKDKDPQTGDPMNGELNDRLYVMNGISLLRKPFIRTWSLTSKNKLNLRMLCHKDGASGNWTSDENQSVVYIPGNGSKSTQWSFANEAQQTNCRERGNCNASHTLYGFINDPNDVNSVKNAIARTEDIVDGTPKQTGDYSCTVFTLDDDALKRFNTLASNSAFMSNPYNSGARDLMNNNSLKQGTNWDRLTFYITVVDKFSLPKTGGMNWNMLMSVVCVLGTGAMAAGFFLDQTKWGRAMLEALLRKALLRKALRGSACSDATVSTAGACSTSAMVESPLAYKCIASNQITSRKRIAPIKAFIRKTAEWCGGVMLRIEWWITERWRC